MRFYGNPFSRKMNGIHGEIYGNISLNSGISWGLAAPRPPHGFPRVLGPKKQFLDNIIFDDLQIGLQTPSGSLFICHQKQYLVGGHPRKKLENQIFGPPKTSRKHAKNVLFLKRKYIENVQKVHREFIEIMYKKMIENMMSKYAIKI